MASSMYEVVTKPVLFPAAWYRSNRVSSFWPSPGKASEMTVLSTLTPVAMAVAAAAESVVLLRALLWVIAALAGKE